MNQDQVEKSSKYPKTKLLQELEQEKSESVINKQIITSGYIVFHNALRLLLSKGKDGCGLIIVYTAILSHANNKNHEAYPSMACLVEETGYTKPVIRGYINRLVEMGLLLKITGNAQSHEASQYFFPYEWEGEEKRYQAALKKISDKRKSISNTSNEITEDELEELDF